MNHINYDDLIRFCEKKLYNGGDTEIARQLLDVVKRSKADSEKFDVLKHLRDGGKVRRRGWVHDTHYIKLDTNIIYPRLVHYDGCSVGAGYSALITREDWEPYEEPLPEPDADKWYWIYTEGKEPFPALYDGWVFVNVDGIAYGDEFKVKRHDNGIPIEAVMKEEG